MGLHYLEIINSPPAELMNVSLGQVAPFWSIVGRVYGQVRTTTMPPELGKVPPAGMLKAFQRLPPTSMPTAKKGGGQ